MSIINLGLDHVVDLRSLTACPMGKSSKLIGTQSLGKAVTKHSIHPIPLAQGGIVITRVSGITLKFL